MLILINMWPLKFLLVQICSRIVKQTSLHSKVNFVICDKKFIIYRFYYDELTFLLEKIDIPELKLTYQDFEEELNRVVPKYEALHALFFCVIIFAPKNNVQDHLTGEVNALNKMTNMMNNLSDRQKERLKIVLDICTKKGWI